MGSVGSTLFSPARGERLAARPRVGRAAAPWLLALALVVAPLLAAELGVRLLSATERLPLAAAHLRGFEVSWTNLQRLGTPDVLILGGSTAQQEIEPRVIGERLAGLLGRPVSVFNLSTGGAGFAVSRAIVAQLAREGRLPRAVIIGVSPGSLRTEDAYPLFGRTPMGRIFTECDEVSGYEASLDCRAESVSALWRWRGHFDRVLASILAPVPVTLDRGDAHLRADGYRSGPAPAPGHLDWQLGRALRNERRPFALGPGIPEAYERLVSLLREHGVAVVPVTTQWSPLLLDALEERFPGWQAAHEAGLQQLERIAGIPIIRTGRIGTGWAEGYWYNPKHTSHEGALVLTGDLWSQAGFRAALQRALEEPHASGPAPAAAAAEGRPRVADARLHHFAHEHARPIAGNGGIRQGATFVRVRGDAPVHHPRGEDGTAGRRAAQPSRRSAPWADRVRISGGRRTADGGPRCRPPTPAEALLHGIQSSRSCFRPRATSSTSWLNGGRWTGSTQSAMVSA